MLGAGMTIAPASTPNPRPPAGDQTHPEIMAQAANAAAGPMSSSQAAPNTVPSPTFGMATPHAALQVAAANTGLRREVLGFVNAGNLNSPTIGYPSWNFNLLSTVVFFGLQVNSGDGALVQSGTGWNVFHSTAMSNFVSKAHSAGTKVLVSIDLHDFSTSPTNQICVALDDSANHPQSTIYQSIQQVQQAGIDGVNIDYEGTDTLCNRQDGTQVTSRDELTNFSRLMKASMPAGMLLYIDTYSGSAEDNQEFFDITGLGAYVDAFFVMAYDMDKANYFEAPLNCSSYCFNPISPLNTYRFNVTLSMSQYTALVPPSKVILGQPYYGYRGCVPNLTDAHQSGTNNPQFAYPTYIFAATVSSQTGVSNFSSHRDPLEGAAEWDTWYDSDFACNREQYFDDVSSLGAKYDVVDRDNLRGVGLFALDYGGGSPELWDDLASHFACPGGRFFLDKYSGSANADLAAGTLGTCVMASTGTAFSPAAQWATVPFFGNRATLSGDVNGDGKADLIAVNNGESFVLTSSGTGFNAPNQSSTGPFYGAVGTFLADVNGDGKADLVAVNQSSVWVMLSQGTYFGPPTQWSNGLFYGAVTTLVGDVSGDGKAEVIAVNRDATWVIGSTGSGFGAPVKWSSQPFYGARMTMAADVSGDGKSDLLAINNGDAWVMTSTGSAFSTPVKWSSTPFYGMQATLTGDVNGDGKVDLVAVNGIGVWVETSNGAAFSSPTLWLSGPP
jgi:spore germination protein YaaH